MIIILIIKIIDRNYLKALIPSSSKLYMNVGIVIVGTKWQKLGLQAKLA